MGFWKPLVELRTRNGVATRAGNVTITPQAQALIVTFPFGGFVWNRPVAVLVERDGRRERIPIFDVTRAVVLVLTAIGIALSLGTAVIMFIGRARAYR